MLPHNNISDVIICDDHYTSALGLEMLLRDYTMKPINIQKASTGKMALTFLEQKIPDLAIIDLGLPDMPGLDIIKTIRAKSSAAFVVVMTGSGDAEKLRETSKLPINALLRKVGSEKNLTEALDFIRLNPTQTYLDASVSEILKTEQGTVLTTREQEVLDLMLQGLTTKEIAVKMNCADSTIKTYRARIMNRSGARNSAEMMGWYLKRNRKSDFGSDVE